ncbi:uncharacterized protein F4807DRAFT_445122 [Annulohypoxylon truncatum]|uniref:uncharacterized protein n=1 Tax=Annulohypoxylon truncatum TaxID=327061 RepID=UPI002008A850|nr:uncharacterized protein F4807DRAFT_445122 [Annulohypoxylon truncatum]KAI1204952.1 hypothetical protein F4807DRAFT_445122 [Annulohypoxylon truncatum]
MRLINAQTLELAKFLEGRTPVQVSKLFSFIGRVREASFEDFRTGQYGSQHNGSKKERGSCSPANGNAIQETWGDTCRIDKKSVVELSESINYMFKWYRAPQICYVYYLFDIGGAMPDQEPQPHKFNDSLGDERCKSYLRQFGLHSSRRHGTYWDLSPI